MANKSKSKGKRVERDVCAVFSSAFNLNFERVPNSGAFIGGSNVHRLSKLSQTQVLLSRGDIIPPNELSQLVIECKGREKVLFHSMAMDSGNRELDGWINQVETDCTDFVEQKVDKGFYCIVIKPNNLGMFIVYRDFYNMLGLKQAKNCINYVLDDKKYIIHSLTQDWLITNKDWFLHRCS